MILKDSFLYSFRLTTKMTFHIPSLRELRIVFDENDSEYIIFDEFKAFLKNNKCEINQQLKVATFSVG